MADSADESRVMSQLLDRLESLFSRLAAQGGPTFASHGRTFDFASRLQDAQKRVLEAMESMPEHIRHNTKFNTVRFKLRNPVSVSNDVDVGEFWSHINNPAAKSKGFSGFYRGIAGQEGGNTIGNAAHFLFSFAPAPVTQGFYQALIKSRGWSELDDKLQSMARNIKAQGGSAVLAGGLSAARIGVGAIGAAVVGINVAVKAIEGLANKISDSYQYQTSVLAPFNAQMSMSSAALTIGDFQRNKTMASAVERTYDALTNAKNFYKDQVLPIKTASTNIFNRLGAIGYTAAGMFINRLWEKGAGLVPSLGVAAVNPILGGLLLKGGPMKTWEDKANGLITSGLEFMSDFRGNTQKSISSFFDRIGKRIGGWIGLSIQSLIPGVDPPVLPVVPNPIPGGRAFAPGKLQLPDDPKVKQNNLLNGSKKARNGFLDSLWKDIGNFILRRALPHTPLFGGIMDNLVGGNAGGGGNANNKVTIDQFLKQQKEKLKDIPGAYDAGLLGGIAGRFGNNAKGLTGNEGYIAGFLEATKKFTEEDEKIKQRMNSMWSDIRGMAQKQMGEAIRPLNPVNWLGPIEAAHPNPNFPIAARAGLAGNAGQ